MWLPQVPFALNTPATTVAFYNMPAARSRSSISVTYLRLLQLFWIHKVHVALEDWFRKISFLALFLFLPCKCLMNTFECFIRSAYIYILFGKYFFVSCLFAETTVSPSYIHQILDLPSDEGKALCSNSPINILINICKRGDRIAISSFKL